MKVTITATGNQGAGKTRLLTAILQAAVAAGVLPAEAAEIEPENIKGKKGMLRERVVIRDVPPIPTDGRVG